MIHRTGKQMFHRCCDFLMNNACRQMTLSNQSVRNCIALSNHMQNPCFVLITCTSFSIRTTIYYLFKSSLKTFKNASKNTYNFFQGNQGQFFEHKSNQMSQIYIFLFTNKILYVECICLEGCFLFVRHFLQIKH